MKKIYLIRHGQTDYNAQGIIQGKGVDSSLNAEGLQQSRAFYEHYRHLPLDIAYTSGLRRTIQTLEPFLDTGLEHVVARDLDEIGWGIFEGKAIEGAFKQVRRAVLRQWSLGNYDAAAPEGESARQIGLRLSRWIDRLRQSPHQNILVCTHGGILAFLMTLLREEPLSLMPGYKHRNTGLCRFFYDGDLFHSELHDDVQHLKPFEQ